MRTIVLDLPDTIAKYGPELMHVFQAMIYKLNTNREKGFADVPLPKLVTGAGSELVELRSECKADRPNPTRILNEAVDVANMGVLVGVKSLRTTRGELKCQT